MLAAAAVIARAPALVQELKREVDREAANYSDIQRPDQVSVGQIFVDRHGPAGRKAAEYVAWHYRRSRLPADLRYSLAAIDVLRLLRSDPSRPLLERLSEDKSTTSRVRLGAAAALISLPGADPAAVISRVLEKGTSADRRDVFFFILRDPDPRVLPATERALQEEPDNEARGTLMLARDLLKNPGKCVLYGGVRQGDGSLRCSYYCPRDIDPVPVYGGSMCDPLIDPEIAKSRSRR
jgi:hypothetical protein